MNIHEVARLSGLSKIQVEQAISRWLITPQRRSPSGHARQFCKADVFMFMIAGEAHRMGLGWPGVRDVVLSACGVVEINPDTDEPIHVFPGAPHFADAVLVLSNFTSEAMPEARFIERAELTKLGAEPFIAFPATRIAKLIEASAS